MLKEVIQTGKTVEEALQAGFAALGLEREKMDYEVLELPKKGFLGFGSTPAKVRVFSCVTKADVAMDYLAGVLRAMGCGEVALSCREEEGTLVITLSSDVSGVVIGRRGDTLDALQYLTSLVANRVDGEYMRVTIDTGNYREKRQKTLEQLARKLANNAVRTGRSATLEPMNPYERRIIHATVATVEGATSESKGEEPNRYVVISAINPPKRPEGRGGYNRSRRPRAPREDRPRDAAPQGQEGEGAQAAAEEQPPAQRPPRERDGGRPPRRGGPRREKPEPYKPSSVREVAPSEAADKPLFGKIELD